MAYGSAIYKYVDASRLGGSPGAAPQGAAAYKMWAASEVVPAGAIRQNGGHVYSTVAGGTCAATGVGPTPGALVDNTVTWVLVGSIGGLYASSDTVQRFPLGAICKGEDQGPNSYGEAEFRYVKFTGATDLVAGQFVKLDAQGQTGVALPAGPGTANAAFMTGIVMANQKLSANTPLYGWVMIRGVFDGASVVTTFTAGQLLCGSATAGAAQAANAGALAGANVNYALDGSVFRAGAAQYACTVELYWPICSGR